MRIYIFLTVVVLLILGAGVFLFTSGIGDISFGTTPEKKHLVGIIVRGASYAPGVDGFRSKMKELGWREGENIEYDVRFVDKREDLPVVIKELLEKGASVLHTYSTPATVEAYALTKSVPIVFGSMGDPLASKIVNSLQHPGTNVTGVSSLSAPLAAKRLEFLKEAVPSVRRVAFPFTADDIPGKSSFESAAEAGAKLGVEIVPYFIGPERDVKATAAAILKTDVDGIVLSSDSAVWANLASYIQQAKNEDLPFAVFDKDMVEKGGLLGYGPDYFTTGEQSAVYADKILRGANPAELPVDTPRRLLLVLNRKTALDIGISFPEALLQRADLILSK